MRISLRPSLHPRLRKSLQPHHPDTWSGSYAQLVLTTGYEGEERIVDEGATYVWRGAVGPTGYWIRLEADLVIDADLEQVAQIDGDVVPSAEVPAWSESAGGGGLINQSADFVNFSTIGGTAQWAMTFINHGVSGESWLAQANLRLESHTCSSADHRSHTLQLFSGIKAVYLNLYRHASGNALALTDSSNNPIGVVVQSVVLDASWTFVEIVLRSGNDVRVWCDHTADPILTAPWASLPNTGNTLVYLGDLSVNENQGVQIIRTKGLKVIRLT